MPPFGNLPGNPPGTVHANRAALSAAGVHTPTQAGMSPGQPGVSRQRRGLGLGSDPADPGSRARQPCGRRPTLSDHHGLAEGARCHRSNHPLHTEEGGGRAFRYWLVSP